MGTQRKHYCSANRAVEVMYLSGRLNLVEFHWLSHTHLLSMALQAKILA